MQINIIKKLLNNETKIFSSTIFNQFIVSGGNFLTSFILIKFLGLRNFGIFSSIWILIISSNIFQQAFIINPFLSISPKLSSIRKVRFINDICIFFIYNNFFGYFF